MDNTVNETWIDKLIDELIDAKNEVSMKSVDSSQLDTLVEIILNSSRLDYNGESLRLDSESEIFSFLRVIYPNTYAKRIKELKEEREAEIAKLKAAQEAKGKEEA